MRKVALVTGGTRGIGLGIATALAKAGFDLALNGVREETAISSVLDDLREYGTKVAYFQGDISSKDDRKKLVEAVFKQYDYVAWI